MVNVSKPENETIYSTSQDVFVGITVFNEEDNIVELISTILSQTCINRISKIYIYDDGSSDHTVSKIQQFVQSKRPNANLVELDRGITNNGKAYGLNKIFQRFNSKYLILLDSDVLLDDQSSFSRILAPLEADDAIGLVGGWYELKNDKSGLYKALTFSSYVIQSLYRKQPLYTAWGGYMALSRQAASQIALPVKLYRIDAFIYLMVKKLGYKYIFIPSAIVTDIKPCNKLGYEWFVKVQKRSTTRPPVFEQEFTKAELSEFNINKAYALQSLMKNFISRPNIGLHYLFFKVGALIENKRESATAEHLWRK